MKKTLLFLALFWLLVGQASAQVPTITRGPYLQKAFVSTDPVNKFSRATVTFRWSTNIPTVGRVRIGYPYLNEPVSEQFGNFLKLKDELTPTLDHSITIDNLEPDKEYKYTIGLGTSPLTVLEGTEDHVFRTPPYPGGKTPQGESKKIKMWVLGDFGAYKSDTFGTVQDKTIDAMKNFMTVNNTGPMDLWLWLGDNAYEQGREEQYQDHIFHKGRARYDWAFRQTPFFATPGNHDYYSDAKDPADRDARTRVEREKIHYYSVVDNFKNAEGGGEPSGVEFYYSFDYGNIHFISLDTYGYEKAGDNDDKILDSLSSIQYKWLERDLIKSDANPNINWVVVFTHFPMYASGTHHSDGSPMVLLRKNLVPLLDRHKVDLVLTGHSHTYERTRLMRGHQDNSNSFSPALHTPLLGSNARSDGQYDGTPNSCFYYKSSRAAKNEGIVYVVNGGGGKPIDPTRESEKIDQVFSTKLMAYDTTMGGSMYIEVENKRLTAKYIAINNQVMDQFTIYKDIDNFNAPRTNGTTYTATCECTEDLGINNSFTHYLDNKGNVLLSINKHNIDIGKVGVPPFEVKLSGALGRKDIVADYSNNYVRSNRTREFSPTWRIMNRYWTVKPATELTGDQQVTIRHYYKGEDWFSLFPGANNDDFVSREYLKFYKVNNITSTYDVNPTNGSHNTMKGATAYNKDGIWVYDKIDDPTAPTQASTLHWLNGTIGNRPKGLTDNYYGEIVIGRFAGGGGIGGQGFNENPRGSKMLINSGSHWRFYSRGMAPPDYVISGTNEVLNWKGSTKIIDYYNNFTNWPEGVTPLGYSPNKEDRERWVIPGCQAELDCYVIENNTNAYFTPGCITSPCATRWTTYYFRKTIPLIPELSNPNYKSIIINYKRDDGVVIYINGVRLPIPDDANFTDNPITYSSLSKNADKEYQWYTVVIPNDGTRFRKSPFNATNTVAVELHQTTAGSSDLQFDLEVLLSQDELTSPTRIAAFENVIPTEPITILFPNPTENGKVYFNEAVPYETFRIVDTRE